MGTIKAPASRQQQRAKSGTTAFGRLFSASSGGKSGGAGASSAGGGAAGSSNGNGNSSGNGSGIGGGSSGGGAEDGSDQVHQDTPWRRPPGWFYDHMVVVSSDPPPPLTHPLTHPLILTFTTTVVFTTLLERLSSHPFSTLSIYLLFTSHMIEHVSFDSSFILTHLIPTSLPFSPVIELLSFDFLSHPHPSTYPSTYLSPTLSSPIL